MARLALNSPEVKSIDEGVKNRFRWSWLQETVQVQGNTFSLNCFSKIREPGKAICNLCNDPINYGTSGKTLEIWSIQNVKAWKIQQQNMRIEIAPADNVIRPVLVFILKPVD